MNIPDDKRAKVIKRIQLLFNRASNAIQDEEDTTKVDHEAQAALEMARRLMLQYGLEEEDIGVLGGSQTSTGDAGGVLVSLATRPDNWALSLAIVVADYLEAGVTYLPPSGAWMGSNFLFYGPKLCAESAAYGFEAVFNQIMVLSRNYKVTEWQWQSSVIAKYNFSTFSAYSAAARREYREGLVLGFARRLKELREAEAASPESAKVTALALRSEELAKRWLDEQDLHPKEKEPGKQKKYTGGGHHLKGEQDSENVQLRKGLK